ncbi:hypothetical protein L1887_25397 [Cichorium endivia]|nr:hypothetical protein L1887_25397 [Cichorium endivia]
MLKFPGNLQKSEWEEEKESLEDLQWCILGISIIITVTNFFALKSSIAHPIRVSDWRFVPLVEKILTPLEGERNTRLENMCWRIWNLARQKKQLEHEEAHTTTKCVIERGKVRRETVTDKSKYLLEGDK